MERDDNLKGQGNSYTTPFRLNDPRLAGRWWSTDPITKPWESPYAGYGNNPVSFIDPLGLDDGLDERPKNPSSGDEYTDDNGNLFSYNRGKWLQNVVVTADRAADYQGTQEDLNGRQLGWNNRWFEDGFLRIASWNNELSSVQVFTHNGNNWQSNTPETDAERSNRRLQTINNFADKLQLALPVIGGGVFAAAAAPAVVPLLGRGALAAGGSGGAAASNPQTRQSIVQWAQSLQGKGDYLGIDKYREITLEAGKRVVGGIPGQSDFYTTELSVLRSNFSAQSLWNGLQVAPGGPQNILRSQVMVYEVTQTTQAAMGLALKNTNFGAGGLPQIVIPNYQTK